MMLNDNVSRCIPSHRAETEYLCEYCGKVYYDVSSFSSHIKEETKCHKKKGYSVVQNVTSIPSHRAKIEYLCEYCGKIYYTTSSFHNHIENHSDTHSCCNKTKSCNQHRYFRTRFSGPNKSTLKSQHYCDMCRKQFSTLTDFNRHLGTIHSVYRCTMCSITFSSQDMCRNHNLGHRHKFGIQCCVCGNAFIGMKRFYRHLLAYESRDLSCLVCGRNYWSFNMLEEHMQTHNNWTPYKCLFCLQSFGQIQDIVQHMKTHVNKEAFTCDFCQKKFHCITAVKQHMSLHYM